MSSEGRRAGVAAAVTSLVAACLMACATIPTAAPEPDPVGVLEAWHEALVKGRPEQAYSLLGPELQASLSLAAFRTLYERQRAALVAQAEALLTHAAKTAPEQRVRVRIGLTTARLILASDGWRLQEPVAMEEAKKPPQK